MPPYLAKVNKFEEVLQQFLKTSEEVKKESESKINEQKKQNNMNLNHQDFIFDKITVTNQSARAIPNPKPNPRFYKIEISGLTTLQQ
jgi:hypothetical protein